MGPFSLKMAVSHYSIFHLEKSAFVVVEIRTKTLIKFWCTLRVMERCSPSRQPLTKLTKSLDRIFKHENIFGFLPNRFYNWPIKIMTPGASNVKMHTERARDSHLPLLKLTFGASIYFFGNLKPRILRNE